MLIEVKYGQIENYSGTVFMEPRLAEYEGCLFGKSLHVMLSEPQFVTVINTSNKLVDLKRDMEIGKVYICETSTSCSPDVNEAIIDPKLKDILSIRFDKALSTEQGLLHY